MTALLFFVSALLDDTSSYLNGSSNADTFNLESWGAASSLVFHIFLPLAGFALLWGRRDVLSRLFLQLDRKCLAVLCPSFSKRERLLKWAAGRLPTTWSSQASTLSAGLTELWRDGSLLCTLINSAVSEACPNPHRHFKKPPTHGQALAYKYLGVTPAFSNDELNETPVNISTEKKFVKYLSDVQQAIVKLIHQNELKNCSYSSNYVARGMGLFTGEQNRKTTFYLYDNHKVSELDKVLISMRGPYGTYAKGTVQPFHDIAKIPMLQKRVRQESEKLSYKSEAQRSLLKTLSMDFSRLINVSNEDEENMIPMKIEMEIGRAKITFIPKHCGIYQLFLVSNGELLTGCPYNIRVTENETKLHDNFDTEEDKNINNHNILKRKVINKIVDFVDEKLDFKTLKHKCNKENIKIENNLVEINNNINKNLETEHRKEQFCQRIEKKLTEIAEFSIEEPENNKEQTRNIISEKSTSPICNNHIVPEVQTNTPKTKQKILQKQNKVEEIDEIFFSFSPTESEVELKNKQENYSKLLSLDKDSGFFQMSDSEDSISTSSNKPEILETDTKRLFKERKEYWNNLCSSTVKESTSIPNNLNNIQETRSIKNKVTRLTKSCDNLGNTNLKKLDFSYSEEDNFEEVTFMSLKDRKMMLMKNLTDEQKLVRNEANYRYPKQKTRVDSMKKVFAREQKNNSVEIDDEIFTPIAEKIRLFDKPNAFSDSSSVKGLKSSAKKKEQSQVSTSKIQAEKQKMNNENSSSNISTTVTYKSARDFFKKLENNTTKTKEDIIDLDNIIKEQETKHTKRKLSLDSSLDGNIRIKSNMFGGSLNLSNKFSVRNLYRDVVGGRERRGSFRGAPNMKAMIETLAYTFGGKYKQDFTTNGDQLNLALFSGQIKKERKSIKSVFEVNY